MKPTDDVSQFSENGMSTTPRTDEVYDRRLAPEKPGITGHELSKQLETELAASKAECARLKHLESLLNQAAADVTSHTITAGELARLRAEVERLNKAIKVDTPKMVKLNNEILTENGRLLARAEKAEADTARMDWIERQAGGSVHSIRSFIWFAHQNLRAAIDAAMKEPSK